jgi:glycosyltransferase involved in cell wall biosynthesis
MSKPNKRRLLLFNLRTDADDHILGFTTRWLEAIAPHYSAVDVVTTHAGRIAVPENVTVYSVGREKGYGRIKRLRIFYATLWRLLRQHRYVACFAHMQPLFAVLSAPLLRLWGVPITTWYTHRSITRQLQGAVLVSRRLVTAVPSSFPIASPKVRAIGHGIDTDFFAPLAPLDVDSTSDVPAPQHPRIVYVARLTAIKRQHLLIKACADLDCEVVLIGDVPDGFGADYKAQLQEQINAHQAQGKRARIIMAGAQTPQQLRQWYAGAHLGVNLAPLGLFDKAALEAMACAVPTLVSNPAFDDLLGEHVALLRVSDGDDVQTIRQAIIRILALSAQERANIGATLRTNVQNQHSLPKLMERLVAVLETGEYHA